MNIRLLGALLVLSVIFLTCQNDDFMVVDDDMMPMEEDSLPAWGPLDNNIFVLNEGNFGSSNGSLTTVNRDSNSVWEGIFELVNEFKLGDVVQYMSIHNDKAYIVVNNSGKIEVADASTLESLTTIDGLSAPRYFLPINDDKAYVTNFTIGSSTTLDVIDLDIGTIIKTIPTGWGEQMVMSSGKVFVGIMNSYDLMVIDAATDEVIETLSVTYAPNSLQVDNNGKVWVLSDGGYYGEDIPALRCINPTTLETEQIFTFSDPNASPQKLAINSTGDQLYFLESGQIWTMSISDTALPSSSFISSNTYSFYGLGVDPTTNYIYTTDAADFQSKGSVLYYRPDATLVDSFEAGVIPGGFCFN